MISIFLSKAINNNKNKNLSCQLNETEYPKKLCSCKILTAVSCGMMNLTRVPNPISLNVTFLLLGHNAINFQQTDKISPNLEYL